MPVSFSCVEVTWTAPSDTGGGTAVITRYIITWNGTEGSSVTVGAGSTTYQVTGLTPNATYSFTVSAENDCNKTSQGATAVTKGICLETRHGTNSTPQRNMDMFQVLCGVKVSLINFDSYHGSAVCSSFCPPLPINSSGACSDQCDSPAYLQLCHQSQLVIQHANVWRCGWVCADLQQR